MFPLTIPKVIDIWLTFSCNWFSVTHHTKYMQCIKPFVYYCKLLLAMKQLKEKHLPSLTHQFKNHYHLSRKSHEELCDVDVYETTHVFIWTLYGHLSGIISLSITLFLSLVPLQGLEGWISLLKLHVTPQRLKKQTT